MKIFAKFRVPHGICSPLFWAHGQLQDSDNASFVERACIMREVFEFT